MSADAEGAVQHKPGCMWHAGEECTELCHYPEATPNTGAAAGMVGRLTAAGWDSLAWRAVERPLEKSWSVWTGIVDVARFLSREQADALVAQHNRDIARARREYDAAAAEAR